MAKVPSAYTANHLARPAIEPTNGFSLSVRLYSEYEQIVDFRMPGVAVLGLDERPPLGRGWGPSPAQLLGSALGACLGSALMRCLRDANIDPVDLYTQVNATYRDDTLGRTHVASIAVRLTPVLEKAEEVAAVPSPERLAERSMIADSLRPDIDLHVAITPEVRAGAHGYARDVVRLVKNSPHLGNSHPGCADTPPA